MTKTMTAVDFAAEMRDWANRRLDPAPILTKSIPIIQEDEVQRFDTDTTPEGSPWPEHKPSTVARYGVHPLLELTGALRAAATGQGPGNVAIIDGDTLHYGVDGTSELGGIRWAGVHQKGRVDGSIPSRKFIGISPDAKDKLVDMAATEEKKKW